MANSGGWCLEACIGLLVGGDQAQPVPGQSVDSPQTVLVLVFLSSVCLLVGRVGSETRAGSLMDGNWAWVSGWRALDLLPVYWCVGLGPGSSGGQGHVQKWLRTRGS